MSVRCHWTRTGELIASEARYRSVVASLAEGIVVRDAEGRVVDCNASAERILGLPFSRFKGQHRFDPEWVYVGEDGKPLPDGALPAGLARRTGRPRSNVVLGIRKPGGAVLWLSTSVQPMTRAPGAALAGTITSFSDITERKRTEENLRIAANALENAAEGISITSTDGRIVSVNKAFTTITGYSADEAIGTAAHLLRPMETALEHEIGAALTASGHWEGELRARRKNGAVYPEYRRISSVQDHTGRVNHYISLFSDISEQKRIEERLEILAHRDPLTGLPNRALFLDRCQKALDRAERNRTAVALLFVDLDGFKTVNDSLGHEMGDLLLRSVAARLEGGLRKSDTVARIGGDEFVVLVEGLKRVQHAERVAGKLVDALARPHAVSGQVLFVTASIGVSCYPADCRDVQSLLRNADAAMYEAKQQGKNRYGFFSPEMNTRALENLAVSNALRHALNNNEFRLHYQPRVDLASGVITGVEALIRWHHPERGLVPPARFIPVAEENGLIEAIGEWALRAACAQARTWQLAGHADLRMAVNFSARQFSNPALKQRITAILSETELDPTWLEVEMTEGMLMRDPGRAGKMLAGLHDMGVSIAIDDFGTGYSSLSYLKAFPIDCIKIDRSFVSGIPHDANDAAITRAIIAMAKSLSLRVVGEGAETAAQRDFLQREGCDEMQGYLFSKPLPADELDALLRAHGSGSGRSRSLHR